MTIRNPRPGALLAAAAALSLVATPAAAQTRIGLGGGWGGWGAWGGGWGRGHRRADVGDILTTILVVGAVAAAADAASKARRDPRYPDRRYPDGRTPDRRDPGQAGDWRYAGDDRPVWKDGRSRLDDAVDSCVADAERGDRRVEAVDQVGRDGDGWRVEGHLRGGERFTCAVDGNGRLRGA